MSAPCAPYVLCVDVGTASARAGVFDARGRCCARAVRDLGPWYDGGSRPSEGVSDVAALGARGAHRSEDIWAAVVAASRAALAEADVADVVGIGFDATCSLVLRDQTGAPLTLGPAGCDTIAWFDHRARREAEICTATGDPALAYQGGVMSPEMQLPKLMWLKRQRPELWARLGAAYDLGDFLTWRATGSPARSTCTLTAKWAYQPHAGGWPEGFLAALDLSDLRARAGLPEGSVSVGAPVGGLSAAAAVELGLRAGTPVSASLIDAFAGALGALQGAQDPRALALIAGTSTCVMALSQAPWRARGIWGPYHGAILPDLWVTEGGQSATGAALDHILALYCGDISPASHERVGARLAALLAVEGYDLAREIHVLPDFSGNRSPLADPLAQSLILGLSLDRSFDAACRLYWRTAVGLALTLKQILGYMAGSGGPSAQRLVVTGGHGRSALLMQLYADATGCAVELCAEPDAVLAGTAMAAMAAAFGAPLAQVAADMAPKRVIFTPNPANAAAIARDYAQFEALQAARAGLPAPR